MRRTKSKNRSSSRREIEPSREPPSAFRTSLSTVFSRPSPSGVRERLSTRACVTSAFPSDAESTVSARSESGPRSSAVSSAVRARSLPSMRETGTRVMASSAASGVRLRVPTMTRSAGATATTSTRSRSTCSSSICPLSTTTVTCSGRRPNRVPSSGDTSGVAESDSDSVPSSENSGSSLSMAKRLPSSAQNARRPDDSGEAPSHTTRAPASAARLVHCVSSTVFPEPADARTTVIAESSSRKHSSRSRSRTVTGRRGAP